jgi:tetratricopeptide (TPR) repeat protein
MLATHISWGAERPAAGRRRRLTVGRVASATRCGVVACALMALACMNVFGQTNTNSPGIADFAARAHQAYEDTKAHYQADSNNPDAGWRFAKACFDWAEFATNNPGRAGLAEEGISASRHLLSNDTDSVPGHYFLAMNLGQLARTKSLGALKIVTQMEAEFDEVLELDPKFDYAGADRNLGLLYLFAPNWPISLGSKSKARLHLQKAVKRSPDFPENHLNLIEAELRWGDKKEAGAGLEALDQLWPEAQKKFTGDLWTADWADWEKRRDAARKEIRPGNSSGAGAR